ncbi:Putative undecaprenyl-diphosphatase YbjG [Legionella massiliensis]|uniref:undecaprenyl-diphosphate phosphatase n=1 Tax=Legionella massiliensis TaxID=1034943 RepID=A0A078KWK0_9GAMM|nr:phosphatase PAP2 family protein [Legionella massiliensis]CDZ76078.1 Putative undecaprenyl-diphosphatase YbjG [Legionella massiliensis]CEE11816.1 Putative undecaprenyl-diphosphatase YbjG [Legionella massiliensis]
MEHLNLLWFADINAGAYLHGYQLWLSIFIAKYLIIFIFMALAAMWLWGTSEHRNTLLWAFCAVLIASGLSWLIGHFWYHPRPFVMGIGHTYLNHAPDSSFPSDHTTVLCTISFVFLWREAVKSIVGSLLLISTACIAWARIYVGVHFPFDIIGAVFVALVATASAMYLSPYIQRYLVPINEFIYKALGKAPKVIAGLQKR